MKKKQMKLKADVVTWRQFTRRGDAVFRSLGREIRIGVLSVATLAFAAPDCAAAQMVMGTQVHSELDGTGLDAEEIADATALHEGDLLFNVSLPKGGISDAITDVTQGYAKHPISHVAIVCKREGLTFALEASGTHGVWLNPIDSFLVHADHTAEGKPMVIVGRLKERAQVAESVRRALTYLGRRYDTFYMPDDKEIYCSELVQLSYLDAEGKPVFPQQPMSFHDETGQVTAFWTEYYSAHGLSVPEGEPGTNPGGISRSEKIDIIYRFF